MAPYAALAGVGGTDLGDSNTTATQGGRCTSLINYTEGTYNAPCITEDDKKTGKIYTVLEEVLDTPGIASKQSEIRKCFRYTEVLNGCTVKEKVDQQKSNIAILKECPNGVPNTGRDVFGQLFDCHEVSVIITDPNSGGIGFLQIYVGLIYKWAAGVVGIIAVLIIVVSGIQISASNGEPEAATKAKERIVQAISGLAVLFFASALLYIINPTFFTPPEGSTAETASTTPAAK